MTFTLEDYLVSLHIGQWFGWSDSKNKSYANLIIHDDTKSKPSEADCTAGVAAMQADWDGKAYARNRIVEYPSIGDQLDMIYRNGDGGAEFQAAIKAIKDKYPKP
jgi:hypothetical protein